MSISGTAITRNTASVAAGSQNNVMLRVRISTNGQLNRNLTQFNLSTTGTKNNAAIASAKIFYTGSDSLFSTEKQFGANLLNPTGNFSCTGSQALLAGNNYFWVVYSVSSQANLGDSLVANVNSYVFNGSTQFPVMPNQGFRVVAAAMSLVYIQAEQTNFYKVEQGSVNNQLMDIRLVMSSTGAPTTLTEFTFDTYGSGLNPADLISNAQLYYTGNNSVFSTQNSIGNYANPQGVFTITTNVNLTNDTNYFWLTYDIANYASVGDSVGSALQSLSISGQTINHNSAGVFNRKIAPAYCKSYAQSITDEEIWRVTLSNLSNTSTCSSLGAYGSILNAYNNYNLLPAANCIKGQIYQLSLLLGSCAANNISNAAVFIDFNQNGNFSDAGELVYTSGAHTSNNTAGLSFTGSIKVPIYAITGPTRMRVVYVEQAATPSPCGAYAYGETEDYTVFINDPTAGTYNWTGTVSNDYSNPNNWVPARTFPSFGDRLIFNGSASIQQVIADQVKTMIFADGIQVQFNGPQGSVLNVFDTLQFGNNSKVLLNDNIQLKLGADTAYIGTLINASSGGIYGNFCRLINSKNMILDFPLVDTFGISKKLTFTLNQLPTTYGAISFKYIQQNPGALGLPMYDQSASKWAHLAGINGFWEMGQQGFPSLIDYNIQLSANGFYGVQNAAELVLMYRQDTSAGWQSLGVHVPTSGSNAMPILGRQSLSQIGQFGVGSDANYNSLPVKFLSVDAWRNINDVLLSWKTAMEINNMGFEIQRSANNLEYDSIGFILGAGNSMQVLTYAFTDKNAFIKTASNALFYRIKQIDVDGKYTYTSSQKVLGNSIPFAVQPVPFTDKLTLSFSMLFDGKATVSMYSLTGQKLLEIEPELKRGNQQLLLENLAALPTGVYLLVFNTEFENIMLKVLK
jgi:hypothetical protein